MRILRATGAVVALWAAMLACCATPATGAQMPAVPAGPVTFVGVGGLRWADLSPSTTPAMWRLTQHAAVASLTVREPRAGTCPIDGLESLNWGARLSTFRPGGMCIAASDAGYGYAYSEGPGDLSALVPDLNTAGTLAGTPGVNCALGAGARIALSDPRRYAPRPTDSVSDLPPHCDLLVADGGELFTDPVARGDQLRATDNLVRDLIARPDHGTVLLAGISDSLTPGKRPAGTELTLLAVQPAGPTIDPNRRPWLYSPSTHRTGLVQLTDLTPTLMRRTSQAELPGGMLEIRGSGARDADLLAAAGAARTVRQIFVPFFVVFCGAELVALALLTAGWPRSRSGRRMTRAAWLWFGAVAPASFVVNLLPWAYWRHPAAVVCLGTVIGATLLATVAALGPWRRNLYGPAAFVGAVTALGLTADVATGSSDQLDALFGLSPLIAGRFYGFGNITFGVYAGCSLVAAAALGRAVAVRHGRRVAGRAAAAVGLVAALIDGWPGLGTDFGGFLSLLPGAAVLAAGIAGIRLRARALALVAAAAGLLITGLAVLDWRRPAGRRTHLGRFVQQVLDGDGPHEIGRKLSANLGLLHSPGTVALLVVILAILLPALLAPHLLRLHALARLQTVDPIFRSLSRALLVAGLLGCALNDSGVIVPAVVLITAGPLLISGWAGLARTVG